MNVLLLYAHPVDTSFQAALRSMMLDRLKAAGHAVDLCDLYAEAFDPRLPAAERIAYHDPQTNAEGVRDHVKRLLRAEALVLCFPVWNYGYPAVLKGYFDRVFVPGVSFRLVDGNVVPTLRNIRRVVAVTSYGGSRLRAMLMGDPPRKLVGRVLRATVGPGARVSFLALYSMNRAGAEERRKFMSKVAGRMDAL